MHPILYEYSVLGYQRFVAGYGLMVALGIVFGLGMVIALAHRRRLDIVNALLVALISVVAGLIGSFLLFLVTIIPVALRDPSMLLQGGLVFYGGPLAAVPAAWIACRRLGIAPMKMADISAPSLAIGHALGRLGCFLGGCCYGRAWDGPWAVIFTHPLSPASRPAVPRHPVQLYESLVLLVIVGSILLLWPRAKGDGRHALAYVLAYITWRFAVEFLRDDEVRGFLIPGLLTTSQAISLALVPVIVIGFRWLGRRAKSATAATGAAHSLDTKGTTS